MNKTAYIHIAWSVKFRAFGITFGNYADTKTIPLPPVVALVGNLLSPHSLYAYNDHGVSVSVSLMDAQG